MALLLLVTFLFQGTWALAGTTGGISGTVTDVAGAPIAGAAVKVVAAAQTSTTATDSTGHFVFLSLSPDTYTVSVEKDQYSPVSFAGVSVFADQTNSLAFRMEKSLKTIATVTSKAAGALVKAGTTSDVYTVSAATAAKVTALGGGGSLDQAYSAIATMPGAYVPVGGTGWFQNVYIRGGDYDQVGYEVDGVPVNRAFDNYPSNTASALGQQEVQVYTGAAPSNAEGQGLSGFINQVIKSGTYPGFASSDLGVGSPIFYHKANIEAGGASPDRRFSYYAAFGGYNQAFRTIDQSNGASLDNTWGTPFTACPGTAPAGFTLPGCYDNSGSYQGGGANPWYVLGPYNYNANNTITDRENVLNFHFAIPHKNDGGRDDLQLLYQASDLRTNPALAPSDWGTPAFYAAAGMTPATYSSSFVYTGALNAQFPTNAPASAFSPSIPYGFPSAPQNLAYGGNIPFNQADSVDNAVGIVKLQYQKNFGSDAYLRLYGYTVYSNWFNWGPNSATDNYSGSIPSDYELYTHTRGLSATFAKQITPQNLLQIQGSYSSATSTRANNGTFGAGGGTRMGILVDSANPLSGICYDATGAAATCDTGAAHFTVADLNAYQAGAGALPAIAPGTTCGGSACTWYIADNGYNGRNNTVKPDFTSGSITDEFDPNDRLHINVGLRFDKFQYNPSNTDGGARPFWLNAWNLSWCHDSAVLGSPAVELSDPTLPCTSLGATFVPATVTNTSSVQTYNVLQPRVAFTYTLNPLNVLRFSYGKYDQAPNTAFEQYDSLQQNLPRANRTFYILGFTAPTHPIVPEISYNTDFSWEHQFKGTDMSFKATPFYRKTQDQIQQFYLDIKTNFVSGLNVGKQTTEGIEFQLQKGDFSKNGLSGLLSYTYTNAYVTYTPASNGATPATTINQSIATYNAFTSACNGGGAAGTSRYGQPVCDPAVTNAAACYTAAGAPVAQASCTAADIANPYWNSPIKGFLDPNGQYAPYDLFAGPSPGAGGYGSFVAPHVATLVVNYKHDKFAITPALQIAAGEKYGYPIATEGIDPSTCTATLAGAVTSDPRYPYGGFGSPFDASTCAQQAIPLPNPGSGNFDGVGAFTAPTRLTLAAQISYDINPRVTTVLTLANIVDTCFGGTKGAWTNVPGISSSKVCNYGAGYSGVGIPPIGNNYNPGTAIQPFQAQSYYPEFGSLPFNAYLDFKIKL
ncbi:MAG: TonB-dependent receptor [Candidatus Baltobacteraceae bacterium]